LRKTEIFMKLIFKFFIKYTYNKRTEIKVLKDFKSFEGF
jgi:hypothetical protein